MKPQCKISKCKTLQDLKRTVCNNECMTIHACQFCKQKIGKRSIDDFKKVDCNNCQEQSIFRERKEHWTACGY